MPTRRRAAARHDVTSAAAPVCAGLPMAPFGCAAAERWLLEHRADLGVRSTLDIAATFLAPREVATR